MYFIQILVLSVIIYGNVNFTKSSNIDNKLSDEERNARCCAKHLSCCRQPEEPTNFEVRALLTKCRTPKSEKFFQNNTVTHFVEKRKKKCTVVDCAGSEDNEDFTEITNCNKKLVLTIKVKNTGITNCKNQYIIIDHVFDPVTEKKQKLLNPYVLKIKQQTIMQTYDLIFENAVNSQAKEKVLNKKDEGYTGCNANPSSQNPTCGTVKYNNEIIPYSTGFCCSCNTKDHVAGNDANFTTNVKKHIAMDEEAEWPKKSRNVNRYDVPDFNKNNEHYEFIENIGTVKQRPAGVNVPKIMVDNLDYSESFRSANNNQQLILLGGDKSSHIQKRGGQDCNDKYTPPNANPDTYHDSTHCLEFSDIWYSVYRLEKPKIFHALQIEIYEKCQDQDGRYKWKDLTANSPIIIGTNNPNYTNEQKTILAKYSSRETTANRFSLNYKIQKLLIPETSNIDISSFPEVQGGPLEYLVVNENQVQANGKQCNVAGVGYEGFAKQPNRCSVSKDSCLNNQPKHMWQHDHEAEAAGKKGCYFLKYFGLLPENPIAVNDTSQQKTLTMFNTECVTSLLDLQVKADNNVVLRANTLAVLTEVYIDSSSPKRTSIIAKVFNSGLVSSAFVVSLTDCPLDMPASFNNIVSKPALIPPQHQHIFGLEIDCDLPVDNFHCALEVLNEKQELIAVRKIRVQKLDRCICIWHCLCACLIYDEGLKCKPLSLQHYHAAGFQGSLPISLHVVQYTFLDDMISLMLYILLFLCLTLFIMGLTKAIVGCCMVPVGLWGLDIILELPKRLDRYYEFDLRDRKVVYDEYGWPVHPDTNQRVRNIPLPAEFCTNVVFFFIYPFAILWLIIKRLCFSSYPKPEDYNEYDMCNCKSGTLVQRKSSSLQNSLTKKRGSSISTIKEEMLGE